MTQAILRLHAQPEQAAPPKPKSDKPEKPYPEFPLFPHATRRWAKKIRGRLHYFGPWDDPDGALRKYLDQKDDLHAGRLPRVQGEGLTLRELCIKFLTVKKILQESGELRERSYQDLAKTCERLCHALGGSRLASDLRPDDFTSLRQRWAKRWGLKTICGEITRVRMLFKFGFDEDLLKSSVRYGAAFKMPSTKTLRRHKEAKGTQMFEADEIRRMLKVASVPLKAMILLGVNCGFGNTDCGKLPLAALDLNGRWVNFPRPKTGIKRRCSLLPETVHALNAAIAARPTAKDPADGALVFITRWGHAWTKDQSAVTKEMDKLLDQLGINGQRSFYALRHTFETIAGDSRDQVAVDHIMGHVRNDMASIYRERIEDARLRAVADHVHAWLFPRKRRNVR
jgi:site-specific recombinase XerD